jgi:FAD synthetase
MAKKRRRKIVLASGVFDLLHLGHVRFLEEAKKAGGKDAELVVIVARDSTVEKRKGARPVMPENQRRAVVESLKVVGRAVLGYEGFDIGEAIQRIKPDVIALGYDSDSNSIEQSVRSYLKEKSLRIKVAKIGHFGEDELDSSSKIKQKIVERSKR